MAYIYLLNLYETIEERINQAKKPGHKSGTSKLQKADTQFHQGRIDLLNEFKSYLKDNMNEKLPKRLRKKMAAANKK
ncbi:MAG: hypothetical protein L3J69_09150 [Desulfobacula sp.]|nr:hypothetical protein [Desulfobacula sp.]